MENTLLKAISGGYQDLADYIKYVGAIKLKEDVLNLLEMQRQQCADKAQINRGGDLAGNTYQEDIGHGEFEVCVDKETILNAKIL